MTSPPAKLRGLLASGQPFTAVECLNAITARVVEMSGFPVAYVGGSGLGNTNLAFPDHGLITTTEMVALAAQIVQAIDIPLIVDGDQGGETSLNVRRTIRSLEQVGVSGVHIEDTVNPKHMYENDSLTSIDEMRARIAAAVGARKSKDFVVIARSDEIFNGGTVEEAIRRGIAYAEEGADAYFVCSMKEDQIKKVADGVPIPLVDINHPSSIQESVSLALNIHTGPALARAVRGHKEWMDELLTSGRTEMSRTREEYEYIRTLTRDNEVWGRIARDWVRAREASA